MTSYAILNTPPASEKPKRTQMPMRRSEFNYMESYMKSLSSVSSKARMSSVGFFRTALCASITVALLAAPSFTSAQNSNKPTRFHPKPRVDDTAPPQAEPETVITDGAAAIEPHSGPAISSFLNTTTFTVPTTPVWTALGPAPIPNGQTIPADVNGVSLTQAPVSGRLTAVAIEPADSNTAYVGAAQGGVYQTRDGGLTWTALMDTADTLAVGSLELDPTDTTANTLLVGSGESNFSGDSYAGFGVYKLTALKSGNPVLSGPFGSSLFIHRGIPGLAIDPNNHNNVYVGSATGQQGIGAQAPSPGTAPPRGLFKSTNFFSGSPRLSTSRAAPITCFLAWPMPPAWELEVSTLHPTRLLPLPHSRQC